jgi:acyl dehydratase
LLTSGGLPLAGGVLGMGCDITWLKPVRPGMTLRVRSTVEDVQVSKSRPGKGVVIVKSETLDESGELVQRLVSRLLVEARGG